MAAETFFAQESANRRRSLLLMASVVALLAVLGFVIGFAFTANAASSVTTAPPSPNAPRFLAGKKLNADASPNARTCPFPKMSQ